MNRPYSTYTVQKGECIISNQDNLQRAVKRRLGQINRIGVSKKAAREMHNSELRAIAAKAGKPIPCWQPSPYIHGAQTMKQYTDICLKYADWLSHTHPDVHKLSYAHTKGYDRDYVQAQIERGLSAWTVDRTCAALAKLHGCKMAEVHDSRPPRKRNDIKRGRAYTGEQYERDLAKYGELVEVCRATGVRKCELATLTPADFHKNANGDFYLILDGKQNNTKGGRSRTVEILPQHTRRLSCILQAFSDDKVMFPKIPKRLNVHAIRALYARDLYKAVARAITELKGVRTNDHKGRNVPAVYHCRDGADMPRRAYDRDALTRVSHSMGHNRACVVATNYLV